MKLIDADKVIECVKNELKQWDTDATISKKDSAYSRGRCATASHIGNKIKDGDFDPPKFSAEAVSNVYGFLVAVYDEVIDRQMTEEDRVWDHLLGYLEQLRESK